MEKYLMKRIEETSVRLLKGYSLELVETGKMDILEALIFQNKILEDIKIANEQYENGNYHEATDEYFDSFKERAKRLTNKKK